MKTGFARENVDNAWCPGCGNFGILMLLQRALSELGADKRHVCFVSGIGQAAKTPHYLDVNMFDGLHGRALPVATAVKAVNPKLTVIAEGGDGDMYGEGGNHLLAAIRRNVGLVHLVHNNMVYGLTKGQASPTSRQGFVTKVQTDGVSNEPFNPLAVALGLRATFVARIYMGFADHALAVLKEAFLHQGYALVDIFQPCVTFNKINTYDWFAKQCYTLEATHDPADPGAAFARAIEKERYPLGIFYRRQAPTFEANVRQNIPADTPLFARSHDTKRIAAAFEEALL